MAKGVIYSIAAFIMGSLVLAFSLVIFAGTQNTELRAMEINIMNRVYDLESSIGDILDELFDKVAITVKIGEKNVSIKEDFPNNKSSEFKSSAAVLKAFVEAEDDFIRINTTEMDNLPLEIVPENIVYERDSNRTKIYLRNPENDYKGVVFVFDDDSGSITWNNIVAGETVIKIVIKAEPEIIESMNVNLNASSSIIVDGANFDAEIKLLPGLITVKNTLGNPINMETQILLDNQPAAVVYPNIIQISFSEFGLYSSYGAILS